MTFEFVTPTPCVNRIPVNGLLVPVPLDETPVKLTEATVLLAIKVEAPPEMPLKTIPRKLPVEPVNV